MKRKISCTILTLLLASVIFLTVDIKLARATITVQINFDGSISPSYAPISSLDNVTYTLTGNISYPTYLGITVAKSNIVINGAGYSLQGNPSANGLDLTDTNNVIIKNTNIEGFQDGIYLSNSQDIITENNETGNTYGIYLYYASNNTISDNDANGNSYGIYLGYSSNNTINSNSASEASDYEGIYLYYSSNNTITGNKVTSNPASGIFLYSSSNNAISGNTATTDNDGIELDSSSNNMISENTGTTNGAEGIYLGYNSSNNAVSGNNATANNQYGIDVYYSSNNNTVSWNNAKANSNDGIYLYSSSNNTFTKNDATTNAYEGILLDSSSGNTVTENTATANNDSGIYLISSNTNAVTENTATGNTYGIYLYSSLNNALCHNNFINNTSQVGIYNSANTWDNGYPSGGNYWSNYNGTDANGDGIGDTAYVVAGNNTDHYPLMGPFGSSTRAGLNVTIFPSVDLCLFFKNVTTAGLTTVNEIASFAVPLNNSVGEYYDVRVGAKFSGNVTVRLIFNGSNMTQNQKSKLQMMQFTLPGDITGPTSGVPDGKVDIRDIAYVAKQFGTNTNSSNWNPMADLTGPSGVPDGKVDIRDIAYVAKNFGAISNWINITSSVDTADNVIYGITTHFSIIGIHES